MAKQLSRRRASQARSKATVERILDAAASLIRETEPDGVTITEIARRADVVIGSVYQYFADRSAINRALLVRHYAEVRAMLRDQLKNVQDLPGFLAAMEAAADQYFIRHQTDPFYHGIWSAVQTDAALQSMDRLDTLDNAAYLVTVSHPLLPHVDRDELKASYALALQFAATTARFVRGLPLPLKNHALAVYRQILRNWFDSLTVAQRGRVKSVVRKSRARALSS